MKSQTRQVRVDKLPGWLPESVREAVLRQAGQTHVFQFSQGERKVFRRRKPIPVSEWAERHRVVHQSSIPGRWHNDVTPYMTGIMDASFFPSVETIIICKTPQTGGSEAIHNCMAYAIDRAPGPAMYVFPDRITAKENAQDRIAPMLEASPRLRTYLTGQADDTSSLRLNLAHMTIYLGWSGSVSRLGNKPIRYLVLDELDKYQNPKNEASSESLAEKRTTTWRRKRKIWKISTPTIEGGPIWRAFGEEAQAKFDFWVRCPHCGTWQLMNFDRIKWPQEDEIKQEPELVLSKRLAWYECETCGACWDDNDRDKAVRLGQWRARGTGLELSAHLKTNRPAKIGFHIPSWLSYFVSLSEIAAAFLRWKKSGNRDDLKDFMNQYKAEPWRAYDVQRSEDAILELCDDRPRGIVPGCLKDGTPRVAALVAGGDTQHRYFRYVIRAFGWGGEKESWLVQAGSVPTFEALEQVLFKNVYLDADGKEYRVRLAVQDAMGTRTKDVYSFCARHRGKVFPYQGKRTLATPVQYSPQEFYPGTKLRIPGGLVLWKVDTTFFKNDLAAKLQILPEDPGAFHLYNGISDEYAREMTAEYYDDEKLCWMCPDNKDNHFWDCEVMALVAAYELDIRNWKRRMPRAKREEQRRPEPTFQQQARPGGRPNWFARR
ncbi:phage terminase large subunit family protein [Desulfobaculum bizertense]|uniref:terminase gpA endonuclease subunit n=1 Tax=Desulfobaculum bizertense TaxID=376490 RepID=UPI001F2286B4|nr:terminase gpA endonuclease subunit [Desulfobaculum bizertense]UIJ38710.1 phage terminase large subunit family protein [Desulfobaculum bizertense]